ncbi:MAG TPA: hypothetical protein VKV15_17640 [Bryobacteraceae bacterium]|nr:hypothetical protein [Bryobacteraceae bacterium]
MLKTSINIESRSESRSAPAELRPGNLSGLIALLAALTMLFAAFSSAYIVRRGLSDDWSRLPPMRVELVSLVLLALGSLALELARRNLSWRKPFARYWFGGVMLGVLFVLSLIYSCRAVSEMGFTMAKSPAAAFFYVLNGSFLLCAIGGLVALIFSGRKVLRTSTVRAAGSTTAAYFWHYLTGLWMYLLILWYVWK